jgi:hypothetical protein
MRRPGRWPRSCSGGGLDVATDRRAGARGAAVGDRARLFDLVHLHQDVNAEVIESEAALAAPMGCGTVLIDDGWHIWPSGAAIRAVGGLGARHRQIPRSASPHPASPRDRCRCRALGGAFAAGGTATRPPTSPSTPLCGGRRPTASSSTRVTASSGSILPMSVAVGHRLRGRRPQDRLLGPGDALPGHATMA